MPKIPRAVILFTLAYLLPAIAAAIGTGNSEFVFYSAVMVILIAVMVVVHRRIGLSQPVLWGLSLWGAAHLVGGLVPIPDSWPRNGPVQVVYSLWLIPSVLKYDQVVHAFGFGVTTLVCWQGFVAALRGSGSQQPPQPTLGILVLCMAASTGFGALNEVVEFAATQVLPHTNVGDYVNTGWDLVSNLVGSVIGAGAIRVFHGNVRSSDAG